MSYTFYVADILKTKNVDIIHVKDFKVINVHLSLWNNKSLTQKKVEVCLVLNTFLEIWSFKFEFFCQSCHH